MPRKVFYSFHYKPDNWRVQTVRNIGAIEGNTPCSANDWESIKQKGDSAVKDWVDKQMQGRSTIIVLVGQNTADRKWVKYEIERAWELKKGVLAIHIHNLKDQNGDKTIKGKNPFDQYNINDVKMSNVVKCYDPPFQTSTDVYKYISDNVEDWIEESHKIRKQY